MLIFTEASPFREIWLDIVHSSSSEQVAVNCRSGGGYAKPEDYVLLRPGSEISVQASLFCIPFPNAGPWRVTAHYHDDNRYVPRPAASAVWFGGTLTSNTIEFLARLPDTTGLR